jgi:hypothetical protein
MKHWLSPKPLVLSLLLATLCTGCGLFAVAARAMPKIVPAAYPGLKGKSSAVMIWTERMIRTDFPTIESDISASLLKKLQDAQAKEKPDDLKGSTFPVTWQSMRRYQQNNPSADSLPIAEVAKEVGVERLIYIEISQFQTRSDLSPDLFRGLVVASLKVVEYDPKTHETKIGYQEGNITVKFPPKGPDEGVLNIGDQRTYVGTINELTSKLVWKFYKHEEERGFGE